MNRIQAIVSENLQTNVWLIPSALCAASMGLAWAVLAIEQFFKPELLGFTPGALSVAAARQIHGVIASSVFSIAGVTFSVTMVALSLTSGQYGPKVIRSYLEDSRSKFTLGLFLGTGLYSLSCLSSYETSDQPYLSVTVALGLTLLSLAGFIQFIHHTATDLQADKIVERIGCELSNSLTEFSGSSTRRQHCDDLLAWRRFSRGKRVTIFASSLSGYVQTVDYDAIMQWCEANNASVQVRVRAGDFILPGSCLLKLHSNAQDAGNTVNVNKFFLLGPIRTSVQDPEYPITQLNQLAARALSPGINDPGTAITCVHGLAKGLAEVIDHDLPGKVVLDNAGTPRLLLRLTDFPGIVKAIYAPLRQMAHSEISVLISVLDSLVRLAALTTRVERLATLQRHADLLWTEIDKDQKATHDLADIAQRYNRLKKLTGRFP
ncbi:MAG: DUF2254 domain-containing protein [Halioglobus sp.]|nr:DUF2254 domain-containing protein [Halioglobus sp.]